MSNDGTLDNMELADNIKNEDFFHSIWQFRETMLICKNPQRISNGIVKKLWVPYMCICAFVCELEIKYICKFSNGILTKGHDLEKLYCNLPNKIKSNVYDYFVKCNLDFNRLLHDYSKTFEQWRYIYEYKQIDTIYEGFLKNLESVLYKELLIIKNNLTN